MAATISGSVINLDFAGGGNITTTVAIPADCTLALMAISNGQFTGAIPTVTSVTLGGVSCVLWPSSAAQGLDGAGGFGASRWYALKAPTTGASVSLDIQMSGATYGRAVIVPILGEHATLWQGTANTANNAGTGSTAVATLGTVGQVGGLILDCVGLNDDTIVVDASQTELWNNAHAGKSRASGSSKAGAASVDMRWTIADARPWGQSVVPVNPAVADGGWSVYRPYTLGSAIAALTTGGLFYYWRRRKQEKPDE